MDILSVLGTLEEDLEILCGLFPDIDLEVSEDTLKVYWQAEEGSSEVCEYSILNREIHLYWVHQDIMWKVPLQLHSYEELYRLLIDIEQELTV